MAGKIKVGDIVKLFRSEKCYGIVVEEIENDIRNAVSVQWFGDEPAIHYNVFYEYELEKKS